MLCGEYEKGGALSFENAPASFIRGQGLALHLMLHLGGRCILSRGLARCFSHRLALFALLLQAL